MCSEGRYYGVARVKSQNGYAPGAPTDMLMVMVSVSAVLSGLVAVNVAVRVVPMASVGLPLIAALSSSCAMPVSKSAAVMFGGGYPTGNGYST